MNKHYLAQYIKEYENQFNDIHLQEIYKWQAVKQFQDHWNPNVTDFEPMLRSSLSQTNNLMDSGNYFPRRMIIRIAEKYPEIVKNAFIDLYNEDQNLINRIASFRKTIKALNEKSLIGKKAFQDHRAVMVYLTLRYPDTYFFYKYEMFKKCCERLVCIYQPRPGLNSNIVQFLNTCSDVKDTLVKNHRLIKLHSDRIGENEYFDVSFNILTQDFIFAVTEYLSIEEKPKARSKPKLSVFDLKLEPGEKQYQFKAKYKDFVSQHKRNKRIGDLGEQFVFEYEIGKNSKYAEKIVHVSKTEGDGLGYDILSYNQDGNKKYIEVKTTKGRANAHFYISGTELARSKKEGSNYFLYRLYNFDEKNSRADMFVLQGDLTKYCNNPMEFEVIPLDPG